jgi:alanine racemase
MNFLKRLRLIRKSLVGYRPSVEVLISRENLLHNLKEYRKRFPSIAFAPVLKSNAYGHGLVQVAEILDKENLAFFVVDSLFEAMTLRSAGIRSGILVIGYTGSENICKTRLVRTAFAITSLEQLREVALNLRRKNQFHIKIDTGMHRQGILPNEIQEAIELIRSNENIILEGVCSHLADADGEDSDFTDLQIKHWQMAVDYFKAEFSAIKFFHLSATAGMGYADKIASNVARLGIGLYGFNPSLILQMDLRPALRMRSVIGSVKSILAGESVGYNKTFTAEKPMRIATVPVGYFEGIDRRLSNVGSFLVDGKSCPIIGRVSMNITSVDVTTVAGTKLGDSVVVISDNPEDVNSVENIARLSKTIPYEILVHIPQHLRRKVV